MATLTPYRQCKVCNVIEIISQDSPKPLIKSNTHSPATKGSPVNMPTRMYVSRFFERARVVRLLRPLKAPVAITLMKFSFKSLSVDKGKIKSKEVSFIIANKHEIERTQIRKRVRRERGNQVCRQFAV